jgi:hypothetical protein
LSGKLHKTIIIITPVIVIILLASLWVHASRTSTTANTRKTLPKPNKVKYVHNDLLFSQDAKDTAKTKQSEIRPQ